MAVRRTLGLVAAALLLAPAAARGQGEAPLDPYEQPTPAKKAPARKPPAKKATPPPAAEPPAEAPKDQPVDPYGQPAEAPPPPPDPADDIDDQVAQALYARGQQLLQRGDAGNAKLLFIESLERSPKGTRSSDALRYLRVANKKLGLKKLDDGRPGAPVDPAAGGAGGEAPIDPYDAGGGADGDGLIDEPRDQAASLGGRRVVMAFSAGAGLTIGRAHV